MKKKPERVFLERLEKQRIILSKDRDNLRDILEDYQEILDNCDEAILELDNAVATLSRLL